MQSINTLRNKIFSWLGPWKGLVFVTFLFLTIASGLFWLDFFRSYQTEIRVIVIEQSEASKNATEALQGISTTLSFYDRILSQNEDLSDPFSGLTPWDRRNQWPSLVSIEQDDQAPVLVITAKNSSLEISRLWAEESAQALLGVACLYYNVREDIELRVIDGPYSKRVLAKSVAYSFTVLGTALLVTLVFFLALRLVPVTIAKIRSQKKKKGSASSVEEDKTSHVGESVPWIHPNTFVPRRPRTLGFEESSAEIRKPLSAVPVKASAPSNLPVAPEETFYQEGAVPENLPFASSGFEQTEANSIPLEMTEVGPEMPAITEPTIEEYKARLNKLLANGNE